MNAPKLRFPGFEGEWVEKRLCEVAQNGSYGMNAAAVEFDGRHKYLRITDIDEGSRIFSPNPLSSPDGNIEEKFKLKKGDLLFARTGASVGKSYLYNEFDGDLYFAGFLIKFHIDKANPYFVYLNTLTINYTDWVRLMSMRSGQPGINAQEYSSFRFSLPTLPEQEKIAEFLSSVDNVIQLLTKKKTLLENYKKGIMQKIFSQEIRFKDDDGNDFPEWEEKRLGEVADKIGTKNNQIAISRVFTNSATKGLVNQQEYFDKNIANPKNLSGYYIVHKDDFVYNPRISSSAPVGPISRNHNGSGLVSPLYWVFRFKKGNLDFFEKYFQSILWHDYMKSIANYGARSDRMNITIEGFYGMPIILPSLPEQQKIADFLSGIDRSIEIVNSQIEKAKEYKKGLLQQMFV
ncbi:hypothetical protein MASR1M107_03820 [Ignavibacteriales bacterium]